MVFLKNRAFVISPQLCGIRALSLANVILVYFPLFADRVIPTDSEFYRPDDKGEEDANPAPPSLRRIIQDWEKVS